MQFILNCSVFGGLPSIENAPFIRVQVMQEPIARRGKRETREGKRKKGKNERKERRRRRRRKGGYKEEALL